MTHAALPRKLAAIMSADVVGYSRLMGHDEAGTLARLKAHREALIDPTIAQHHGRIVKLMGDGLLIEFVSVVDAVTCGLAIQQGMDERNQGTPESKRIIFRIGINVGDVIVDGADLYGDGVNIAARLEALAEPGTVYLSEDAYRQARGKLTARFQDQGEHQVKNIAEPVRVYQALPDTSPNDPTVMLATPRTSRRWQWAVAAVAVVLVGGAIWHFFPDIAVSEVDGSTSAPEPNSNTVSRTSDAPPDQNFQVHYVYRRGQAGEVQLLQEGSMLQSGDHYKIQFQPQQESYVYIFQIDSSDAVYQLFPEPSVDGATLAQKNPVQAGTLYHVPSSDSWFELDDQQGQEHIYFLATQSQSTELETLADELRTARQQQDTGQQTILQNRLTQRLTTRGPARIVVDDKTQTAVKWTPQETISLATQRLENLCAECANKLTFEHR